MRRRTGLSALLLALTGVVFSLSAHAGAGDLDPTFGTGGRTLLAADPLQTSYAYVTALAIQPDAKILVLGYGNADGGSLVRLTAAGALDPTFGTSGRADPLLSEPFGLAVQGDGKILVASSAATGIAVARLNADGSPDFAFGGGTATAVAPFGASGAFASKLLVQPDGRIVAIGYGRSTASSNAFNVVGIARLLPNGTPDTTFGGNGTQVSVGPATSTLYPAAAALQADGGILIAGYATDNTNYAPLLLRLTPTGQIDGTFATTAPAALGFVLLFGVAVQSDGMVILSGAGNVDLLHARLKGNGTPDPAYGTGGVVKTTIPGFNGFGHGVVLQPDGKALSLFDESSDTPVPRLLRFTTSGALDPTFGTGGISAIPLPDATYPTALLLQPDGKVVTGAGVNVRTGAGSAYLAHEAVFRYQGDSIAGTIVEFFNAGLGHYFITANPAEQASIDAGGSGPGWTRTGLTFRSGGISRACRFYGTPGRGPNSHFYTIDANECSLVRTDPGWHFESYDFSATPPGPGNSCAAGTTKVYRAYNGRFAQNDSNHRYTTSLTAYNAQVAAGWTGEGVLFCVPL